MQEASVTMGTVLIDALFVQLFYLNARNLFKVLHLLLNAK